MKDCTVVIPKFCCVPGCRKMSAYAWKLSDFWLTACEEHKIKNNTSFSINRALEQLIPGKKGVALWNS